MKNQRETNSQSRTWLRIGCFVLAVAVALVALSYGFTQLGHKDPGYYEIEATPDEDTPLYSSGITLIYYFEGESSQIKQALNSLKDLYSTALMRSYKLLDPENTYEGYVNLASLNQGMGQSMQVSEELFSILEDAWAKTQEGRGFNMFAGSLYREWNSILSLNDLSDFDPATNPDTASRIRDLAEKTAQPETFELRVLDRENRIVQVNVDQAYLDFLEQGEYACEVVSMNLMEDAYRLSLIRDALEAQGFTNGYLSTDSGLTLSLSRHEDGAYGMYSYDGERILQCASIDAKPNSACSYFRVFPMETGEFMYHAVDGGYYHPCFITATGTFANVLNASCTVRYDGDVVAACYDNLKLYNLESREAVTAAASGDTTYVCAFLKDGGTVLYTNDPSAVRGADGIQVVSNS